MSHDDIEPTLRHERMGQCEPHEVYDHPAYGTIQLTNPQGSKTLFGSDVNNMGCIRISIHRATLHRDLSHDWIHSKARPIVTVEMTHAQFAGFITGVGKGDGTPVTIVAAPPEEALSVTVPGIKKIESKHETFRREIRAAASTRLSGVTEQISRLETMLESGKLPMKELRQIVRNLRISVDNMPSNLAFVVESAEEALEKATTDAKIEVEAFCAAKINALGVQSLEHLVALGAPEGQLIEQPTLPAPSED